MVVTEHAPAAGTALAFWATKRRDTFAVTTMPTGLRFAFYGRVSTEDHQDPAASKGWQLRAQALTSGHGRIVAGFFDVGHTRVLPCACRPDAAALVAALADPDCGFDAIGALARLRADGMEPIYDQADRTVTANTEKKERVAIGR